MDFPEDNVIMFDFDGVIADSFEIFFREYTAALNELGYYRLNSREALLKLFDDNALKQLLKQGFPLWRLKRLGEKFKPRIQQVVLEIPPFPEMPGIVSTVAGHYPVYVVTSNVTSVVEDFLARHDVRGVLDVLGADKEKSKVRKIRQVRKRHPGAEGWFIGDTRGDMLEGRRAGVVTVATAWGWHDAERLATAKPAHLLHEPAELLGLFRLGDGGEDEGYAQQRGA